MTDLANREILGEKSLEKIQDNEIEVKFDTKGNPSLLIIGELSKHFHFGLKDSIGDTSEN